MKTKNLSTSSSLQLPQNTHYFFLVFLMISRQQQSNNFFKLVKDLNHNNLEKCKIH